MTIVNDVYKHLPKPDADAAAHTTRLLDRIYAEIIAAGGAISFARFMELALYAPGLGYYRAGTRKFGSGGDFITAPELSALFSRCVARQCRELLAQLAGGVILELGAGTGIMAADILRELHELGTLPERYVILELSGELRARQRQTLSDRMPDFLPRVDWLDTLPESGFRGVILCNEVLDALPVERFRITANGPHRLMVKQAKPTTGSDHTLEWAEEAADATLTAAIAGIEADIGYPLPEGYTSEYVPHLADWVRTLADSLTAGALLLIDYGYSRRDYYHPERNDGTLLCHYRHRVHADPLILPGLQDITASVDFTAVADAGRDAGLEVAGYTSQSYFLFGCGIMELLSAMDPADTVHYFEQARQAKMLILPGEMGERFKAIGLTRGIGIPLQGFTFKDQRHQL